MRGVPVTILAAALWCSHALAAPAPADPRIERIYLELGKGDFAHAGDDSAALLAHLRVQDPMRMAALDLRLDVLTVRTDTSKPDGAALAEAIDTFAAHDPRGRGLAARLKIQQAVERGDGKAAADLAQTLPDVVRDPAEVDLYTARALALVPGRLDEVRERANRALALWHDRRGMRARMIEVELHYTIGTAELYSGSSASALAELERGAKLAIDAFGPESYMRFRMDAERAGVFSELGRSREALELREGLYETAKRSYGENSVQAAKAEGLLGAALQEIGDYGTARPHYEHAQKILEAAPDTFAHERIILAANFANLLQEMDEEQAALTQYQKALDLTGTSDDTMHMRAVINANIGNTEVKLQRYEDAIVYYRRALELREKSDGKESPGLAYSLEGLGSASLLLKRYADAEGYFRRALDLRQKGTQPNHPSIGPLRFGLALARWGEGDTADAFRIAVEAAEHQQEILSTFAADFSERQSVAFRELMEPATALVASLAAERGDAESVATAWRLAMVERGLVARTQAYRLAAARSQRDPDIARAFATWREANRALGEAWLDKATTAERMSELKAAAENAQRALWHGAGVAPELKPAPSDIAALARALPADAVLVAFGEGLAGDPARSLAAGPKPQPEDWYAFVLRSGGAPRMLRVGQIAALSAEIRAWYADLRDPDSDRERLRRDGEAIRAAVFDVALGDAPVRRVFVVPEGEIYRLSFAALPGRRHAYLIEDGQSVHTLAHESDLLLPAAPARAGQALLAGAPDFPSLRGDSALAARSACLGAARAGFAPIPNAAKELDDLQALFAASSTSAQVVRVSGADATRERVLAAMPQADVVHLATHGFSLDETCVDSAGARGVTLDVASAETGNAADTALSGLAFSGAGVVSSAMPAGIVSAGELATLDLSHVSWIALSACDSGLGPIGRNEGVFGMRRALRLAGAHTVVMSLWQVDDAATAELMRTLYRARFVAHDDVPDALAAAMRDTLAARRTAGASDHPYYWAAFIGEGAWR